ncbi:MAG: hypothetical protein H0W72_02485 [Planctomycetes bacterium]|nr:hypothetical protein [Planctomycetota bacterium]
MRIALCLAGITIIAALTFLYPRVAFPAPGDVPPPAQLGPWMPVAVGNAPARLLEDAGSAMAWLTFWSHQSAQCFVDLRRYRLQAAVDGTGYAIHGEDANGGVALRLAANGSIRCVEYLASGEVPELASAPDAAARLNQARIWARRWARSSGSLILGRTDHGLADRTATARAEGGWTIRCTHVRSEHGASGCEAVIASDGSLGGDGLVGWRACGGGRRRVTKDSCSAAAIDPEPPVATAVQ